MYSVLCTYWSMVSALGQLPRVHALRDVGCASTTNHRFRFSVIGSRTPVNVFLPSVHALPFRLTVNAYYVMSVFNSVAYLAA
jgi:hypothetical protein